MSSSNATVRPRSGRRVRVARWRLAASVIVAGFLPVNQATSHPLCRGTDPWVLVQLRAEGWNDARRENVLLDLQRTLAGQGIGACLAGAHPLHEPLATLGIELGPDSKASVDIDVRDAVTHKSVRRAVDLAGIPPDGRELAIAIEADEMLRASWAEVALDTDRARAAQPQSQVVGSVDQVLAPSHVKTSATLGARLAGERYFGVAGTTLLGADGVGRVRLWRRGVLELAGGGRVSPSSAAPHGRVRALAAGASLALLFRIAGPDGGASLDGGASFSGSWLEFRAAPVSGAEASAYSNLLLVGRVGLRGRFPLGRALHVTAGLDGGRALRGVEATDAGEVVAGASGFELGAAVGLELP